MRGFKYLLLAAEAGDRSSMIIVARAFDTGINLPVDRSVKIILEQSKLVHPGPTVLIILPPRGISREFLLILQCLCVICFYFSIMQKSGLGRSDSLV